MFSIWTDELMLCGIGIRNDTSIRVSQGLERTIGAIDELIVRAGFDNTSTLQHNDLVSVTDCRESVGDRNDRQLTVHFLDRLLDSVLILGVQTAGCFVQDQNGRAAKKRPGQRDSLPFAT
jgi:hypothetical protein